MPDFTVQSWPIERLVPYAGNPRKPDALPPVPMSPAGRPQGPFQRQPCRPSSRHNDAGKRGECHGR